ncbi:MAG: efflux RND transporter permease subunit [Simkania sp.]|nr:efflux RND transporter permease subunit [Simkania sp.]
MNNLSAPFIRRPVMTTLVMAAILFFGILSFQTLPVSDLPNVDYPTIKVTTSYPGASPDTVANNVTAILEKQFTSVDGIQLITSSSTTGSSTIALQFDLNKPIEDAAVDVQAAINQAQANLPSNLPYLPTYTKVNPSASPILYLSITSATAPLWDLYTYAYTLIGERLNMISGVAQVSTYGSPYAVRVRLDPRKLTVRNIGLDEVGTIVKNQNADIPVGTLYGSSTEYTIDVDGQLMEAAPYNQIILKSDDGTITRISDVGYAMDGVQFDKYNLTYLENNLKQPCCVLAIIKQPEANALSIIDAIDKLLPTLQREIPGSVEIKRLFDRGVYIEESVHDVELTLLLAFILVVLVIFIYLGEVTATVIPSCALPLSLVGTFAVMSMLHFNIDILSLLAITLSIGFLVDDAIVVLENIMRHVEMGKPVLQAALDGSKEISFTVLSMTLCLCSVFIPLIFMGGVLGLLFREFSITIMVAVLFSGFISLTLTPLMASRFVTPRHHGTQKPWMERFSETINTKLLGIYKPMLEWVVHHRKTTLVTGLISLIATVYLILTLPKDFLPADDLGFIQGFSEAADGTSSFMMENYQNTLTSIVSKHPAIASVVSIGAQPQDNQGLFFIRLKDQSQRPPIQEVIGQLYRETVKIPGLKVFFKSLPLINLEVGTQSAQANYQYTLYSLHPEALYPSSDLLRRTLLQTPGFTQVNSDLHISQPQYSMKIRRDKASMLGVTAGSIETALNLAYANTQLSPINTPHYQYYVIMETVPEFYRNPLALRQLWISSANGNLVPLSTIVSAEETTGPLAVNHVNGLPSVTITFDVNNIPLGTAVASLDKAAQDILPPTVYGELQGSANVFQESFANLQLLLLVMVFAVYIILGILYENFIHPLTVMSTLPPAALGGLLTLMLFGLPLSLYAFVGIVMLLGIVMKNGIIMIDFANERITKEAMNVHDAIVSACLTRFRPILMTTIAALMGAVPIALGVGGLTALSRKPLGIVIVGGLIFSQILTLFFTPVIFIELETLRETCRRKFFKNPSQDSANT